MKAYLKVKIKSLAEEAKIIRKEERFYKSRDKEVFWGLRGHRIVDVREEQRAALLAYGYIRGKTYKSIECDKTTKPVNLTRVRDLVIKYGTPMKKDDALGLLHKWTHE
jgi:hypothetical protein